MRSMRHPELENQHCLSINCLPPRATMIPAGREGVFYQNKEASDRIFSLNGDWDFLWKPDDLPVQPGEKWDTIDVPSVWQYRGYGRCVYPNVEYPIPFAPPYVLAENPVGYYRRSFTLDRKHPRTVLHFAGVDCAYYVWLNGEFAGFAKGSRCAHEFDVSGVVRAGENRIEVKVYAYSDATYLENQDMLLASGIFRDVYLIFSREAWLEDYFIATDRRSVTITASCGGDAAGCTLEAAVDGAVKDVPLDGGACVFAIENPREWNAEDPQTYDVVLRLKKNGETLEMYTKRVGLRDMEIRGNLFLLNGKPIRFKGVNRHEYDPDNGRAISVPFIRREMELLKRNNMNAIRCSHYTNNPAFYEICTELGVYIMDEADIESHGCGVTGDQGFLSKDPSWLEAYLDRTRRMAERDKNESCIVIWSIGNECGRGENIVKCAEYLRSFRCPKPILQSQDADENDLPVFSDFRQRGYQNAIPPAIMDMPPEGPPIVFTEYEHGMGNTPGSLDAIWDIVYDREQFAGGWAWEFKSHGFHVRDEKGRDSYLYGGDFGDINNWSNFTMDGYLFSDGSEKPAMHELKQAYGPVRAFAVDGRLVVESTRDFVPLDDLVLRWNLTADGHVIREGVLPLPAIPPRSRQAVMPLPALPDENAEYFLNLVFTEQNGFERAARQLALRPIEKMAFVPAPFAYTARREPGAVEVNGGGFRVRFEKGTLCLLERGGERLLSSPMRFNLWRAPTDNDGIVNLFPRHIAEWDSILLWDMKFHAISDELRREPDCLRYEVAGRLLPSAKSAGFLIHVTYRVYAGGIVGVEIHGEPFGFQMVKTLPRIGICFKMDKRMDHVRWYGRGFEENYRDRKLCAPVGVYESSVAQLNTQYDVPQECGNREETRWLALEDKLSVVGSDLFSFSYHDFTLGDLTRARHRSELEKSPDNYLYIDYMTRGLGSLSCGPEPVEEHELRPHSFRFTFTLAPGGQSAAEELYRQRIGAKTEALSGTFTPPEHMSYREMNECRE